MKILESKRSEIRIIGEFRGIPNRFPNLAWREFLGGRGADRCKAPSWGEATQQPARVDERHKRGATRSNSTRRAGGAGGQEASALWEALQQLAGQEAWEGRNEGRWCNERWRCRQTGGSGVTRGDTARNICVILKQRLRGLQYSQLLGQEYAIDVLHAWVGQKLLISNF